MSLTLQLDNQTCEYIVDYLHAFSQWETFMTGLHEAEDRHKDARRSGADVDLSPFELNIEEMKAEVDYWHAIVHKLRSEIHNDLMIKSISLFRSKVKNEDANEFHYRSTEVARVWGKK